MSNFFDDFKQPEPYLMRLIEVVSLALTVLNVIFSLRIEDNTLRWVFAGTSVGLFVIMMFFAFKPQLNSKTTNHNAVQLAIDRWMNRLMCLLTEAMFLTIIPAVSGMGCGEHKNLFTFSDGGPGVLFYVMLGLVIALSIVYEVLIVKNRNRNEN